MVSFDEMPLLGQIKMVAMPVSALVTWVLFVLFTLLKYSLYPPLLGLSIFFGLWSSLSPPPPCLC